MPNVCGDAVFPGEAHWGIDAQCLRGMLYSPVKFIGAPDDQCLPNVCRGYRIPRCPMFAGDAVFPGEVYWGTRCPMFAQCLQGMPYSPVKFTGAPDAQCLQGMPYSLVKFMPNVCRGCCIPR